MTRSMPMKPRARLATLVALAAVAMTTIQPAAARSKHRHLQAVDGPMPAKSLPIPYAYSYYPNEIEGGVSGNLSFNNQIRKFKDPLNANGGR